jgi:hypothetical protein
MSTEEDTMSATGWKHLKMDNDEIIYIVQVDRIVGKRKENKLLKEMSDWNLCGDGFNPKTRETTYIFKKAFQSEKDWMSWGRSFPYNLVEISPKSSKKKPYKLGLEYLNSPRRRKNG